MCEMVAPVKAFRWGPIKELRDGGGASSLTVGSPKAQLKSFSFRKASSNPVFPIRQLSSQHRSPLALRTPPSTGPLKMQPEAPSLGTPFSSAQCMLGGRTEGSMEGWALELKSKRMEAVSKVRGRIRAERSLGQELSKQRPGGETAQACPEAAGLWLEEAIHRAEGDRWEGETSLAGNQHLQCAGHSSKCFTAAHSSLTTASEVAANNPIF